jgi:hypothetical protein
MLLLAATSLLVAANPKCPLIIDINSAIRVAGQGCRPHANVVVTLGEARVRKRQLVTFPADGRRYFSRMVSILYVVRVFQPFGLVSKSHSRRVTVLPLRSNCLASAAPMSRV